MSLSSYMSLKAHLKGSLLHPALPESQQRLRFWSQNPKSWKVPDRHRYSGLQLTCLMQKHSFHAIQTITTEHLLRARPVGSSWELWGWRTLGLQAPDCW